MKATVTIEIDTDMLPNNTDSYLAAMWHVAQANPMNGFENREPGELAECIGREIIRRFLLATGPDLWTHQGHHYDWSKIALAKKPEAEG